MRDDQPSSLEIDHTFAVIMAGGSGSRLWPVSRKKHPKHLLPLLGERTLFQGTMDRLEGLLAPDHILVVTTADQARALKKQAPQLPEENFLVEPEPRGTAAVVGLAGVVVRLRDPDAVMLVLPSDHSIRNRDLFQLVVRSAVRIARKGYLVTLGIAPTFPATGYGYIQRGNPLEEESAYPAYHVRQFKEKPTAAQARSMLADGDHSWNSGMFIWRADRILEEFSRQLPDLKHALERIGSAWGTARQQAVLDTVWPGLKTVTIDYGIMEHAERVAVLPAGGLEWSDVGSWDSLFDALIPDEDGNVVVHGHHIPMETHASLVYAGTEKLIVTIGVDDLIIIDTPDAMLVCRKDQAQQVRQVISELKNSDRNHYL
jgi:mannose-1-phosphate guanylyltransferase